MKNSILIFFGCNLLIILFFSYSKILYLNSKNRINPKNIEMIKLGMSSEDVISILGKPISIKDKFLKDEKTFTYTEPIKYAMTYPMLWVHFDNNHKVNCIYAKKYIYWGADDECIYLIDKNYNPKNPDINLLEANF